MVTMVQRLARLAVDQKILGSNPSSHPEGRLRTYPGNWLSPIEWDLLLPRQSHVRPTTWSVCHRALQPGRENYNAHPYTSLTACCDAALKTRWSQRGSHRA